MHASCGALAHPRKSSSSASGAAITGLSLGRAPESTTMPMQTHTPNDHATSRCDNPAAPDRRQGEEQPSRAQLEIRETTEVGWAGFMVLLPPLAPRYLLVPDCVRREVRLFDLLRPSGPGVAVLHGEDRICLSAAVSADGDSICVGYGNGPSGSKASLNVYDTAALLATATALLERAELKADNQCSPRAHTDVVDVIADVAFSHDAARLFALWRKGAGVTVHDTGQSDLPVLRSLPFSGLPDCYSNYQLACAGGLLAAAGGGGENSASPSSVEEARSRQQVQLWRVDASGETELRTVRTPDLADSVTIRSDGSLIAIGLRNGVVRLLSPLETEEAKEQDVVEIPPPDGAHQAPMAQALSFSLDGSKLVAGRARSDDFTVYDVTSTLVTHHFVRPKSSGFAATFFPAGDVLVTGGTTTAQQCMFHRLLPPTPCFELAMTTFAEITSGDVATGGECGSLVAMAAGSQVEVLSQDGNVLLQKDLGRELFTSLGMYRTAVRIQPGGKFLACTLEKKVVVVLAVADGSESLRFPVQGGYGTYFSPDGALLAVADFRGATIFSVSDAGLTELRSLEKNAYCVAFDCTGARVAIGTIGGRLTIWDTTSWKCTHAFTFESQVVTVCFSCNGDRLAYQSSSYRVEVLSLRTESESKVLFEQVNAYSDLKFSPDDKFLLCCPDSGRTFDRHRMRVLDLATGADTEWGELLRTMALPVVGGTLCGRTIGWAQLPLPQSRNLADSNGEISQWVLYGAVGKRLVAVDINLALHAVRDSAWTTEQLTFCSEHQQECVGSLAQHAPHCCNIQDVSTGETMFHCMTRTRQVKSLERWLGACPHVTPVADSLGQTAVQVALQLDEADVAAALWQALSPSLTLVSASLVMQELQLMSKTHPQLVLPFLMDVEPCVVRTLATFRTDLARKAEVCGLPTATLTDGSSESGDTASELKNTTDQIPSVWADFCPVDAPKMTVEAKVVVLPGLLEDVGGSPFHDIVAHCHATVFDSKLLQLIVQYKWEKNVRSMRIRSVALYLFAFVVGAIAMILSVQGTSSTADVLQGLVVVIEVSSLGVEAFQLTREGCATYFTGPWNLLDIMSSGFLLVASTCYFAGVVGWLRTAGALGVALKCFGTVDYLRSFPATGSLVRMIMVILTDMVPFLTILSVAMFGCMLFFMISMSSNFDSGFNGVELFRLILAVYHMTLGMGAGIDTSEAPVTTIVVVTLLMSFVVVVLLNLLIAIMGDSYEKVKEFDRVEAIRETARVIVEAEKQFPRSHQYHRFMHFVEVTGSAGQPQHIEWEGMTKRVTDMVTVRTDRLERKLDDELAQIKLEMNKMNSKFEQLDGELSEMKSAMDNKLDSKLQMILDRLK